MSSSDVENFKVVTGCETDKEAHHFLDACHGSLATAVDLFYHHRQMTAHDNRSGGRKRPMTVDHNLPGPSNEDVTMISDDNDQIRAPMLPKSGVIVEQSYDQTYETQRDQLLGLAKNGEETNSDNRKRNTLEFLFRPPLELLYNGTWESARQQATEMGRWLLVNVQDVEEFACQTLNRDVWANDGVRELVSNNLIFWQVYYDSPEGRRMEAYYKLHTFPAIFIVDPRSGEFKVSFNRIQDAISFSDQMTSFLDDHPDFISSDAHFDATSNPNQDSFSKNKASCRKRQTIEEIVENGACYSSQNQMPPVKVCKIGSDDLDAQIASIDDIINGGERLTTVDKDEWQNHIVPSETALSLLIRLPDGVRERLTVTDQTHLDVLFFFLAGRGFAPIDHLLVLSFPKRVFSCQDSQKTFRTLNFPRQQVINVERK